jgi:hypothetical protein
MDRSATGWRTVSLADRLSPSAETFRARLLRDLLARAPERRKTMTRRRALRKARQVAGSMEDVTDRKEADERLLKLGHCDTLTGLPSRVRPARTQGRLPT